MNPEQILRYLVENGKAWVQAQRDRHRSASRALTAPERAPFGPFFDAHILDTARVCRTPLIENHGFYAGLAATGVPPPLDFTHMEGITFVDTILVSQKHHPDDPPSPTLLFHELVHVVQYALLGRNTFVERYVRGWAENAQDYFRVSMESYAYALQARYERIPGKAFQ